MIQFHGKIPKIKIPKIKIPQIKIPKIQLHKWSKEEFLAYHKRQKERRAKHLEDRRKSGISKKLQPVYRWMNRLSVLLHYVLACFLNLLVEVISRHSFLEAWRYMLQSPKVFLFNGFLILVTFSLVYLVRRRVFARIFISIFWLLLGTCNGYLLLKRVTPFNAQDLKTISDALALNGNYYSIGEMVLMIIGVVAVCLWIVYMWRRGGQYQGKIYRIPALLGVGVWVLAYMGLTNYALDQRIISNYFGNIAFAYEDYGFPYCFTASVFNTGISQPAGYSEETMEAINEDGKLTESTVEDSEQALPNILFVQLESYFDPTEVEWLEFSQDPTPNLRKLSEEYSSGYFKVPSIGAGTANTEFEVLTGMSMRFFGPGEYPYKTYAKYNVMESAATALTSLGYGAQAVHNNGGNFYSRAKVFNNMGFDHYISKEFMNILQTTPNGWAKDDVLLPNIMEAMDTTTQTDFVMTISVQGHGSYPTEKTLENPQITVSGVEDEGEKNAWEYYVNQVYEMDQFAGKLIQELTERGEPTVVVFYGDHLPTLNLETTDLKSRYLYNTNYVIWDNIGLEKEDGNYAAYQIMAEVFDRLGIHSGTIFNYHQQRMETKNYLADLELLQYDILYGEQYVYGESGSTITGDHMVMGVENAVVTDIVAQPDGYYSLYGENFTKQSNIYVNGEKQDKKFLNNTRIDLKNITLKDGDLIVVAQVGSSDTIFRTSQTYEYQAGSLVVREDLDSGQTGRNAFEETDEEE